MNNSSAGYYGMVADPITIRKQTLNHLLNIHSEDLSPTSPSPTSTDLSPSSVATLSTWTTSQLDNDSQTYTGLIGSLFREEGHIYSLAAAGDLLFTGSESKNIRVWKNHKKFSSFRSRSGLVKTIIISRDLIFSGHQDGKVRIWKASQKDPTQYKRVGSLPTLKSKVKSSLNPGNYIIESRKARSLAKAKHGDAVSCLVFSEDGTLLYSASWDRTFKVWRISDSKCLESVAAHDDAVNAVVAGFGGLVFTGSADGTVKLWRREVPAPAAVSAQEKEMTRHVLVQTLLEQECAVTSLAVDPSGMCLYCGSSDGLVNFWERRKVLLHGGVLRGHKLAVLCLATAGNLVFSGSADNNICVWRREEGRHVCLAVLTGHSGPVKCLAAEAEEEKGDQRRYTVYSGSIDRSVKIWKVTVQAAELGQQTPTPPRRHKQTVGDLLY